MFYIPQMTLELFGVLSAQSPETRNRDQILSLFLSLSVCLSLSLTPPLSLFGKTGVLLKKRSAFSLLCLALFLSHLKGSLFSVILGVSEFTLII